MTNDFILNRITLHNFYLYKDDVTIDFDNNDPSRNLFLFIFPNGGGKTSLYHAIKWGFYGNKFKYFKDQNEMKPIDMINSYAAENNEGFFVEIDFIINGETYVMRRTCQVPRTGVSVVELKTPTGMLLGQDANDMLDLIVPPNYGSFFMFDGRDLSSLSAAQDDKGQVDSILKLLGMSSIQTAAAKIEEAKKAFEESLKIYKNTNKDKTEAEREYYTKSKMEEDCNNELETINANIKKVSADIEQYEELINGAKEVQKLTEKKNELKIALSAAIKEKELCLEQLSGNRTLIHRYLFKNIYESIISEDSIELKRMRDLTGLDENEFKSFEVSEFIIERAESICPACGQKLTPADYERIKKMLEENENKLKQQKLNEEKITSCAEDKKFFESMLNSDYRGAYKSLVKYQNAENKIEQLESEIKKIDIEISKSGVDSVERWFRNLTECKEKKILYETEKATKEKERAIIIRDKDKALARMKVEGVGDVVLTQFANRIDFCSKLITKLNATIQKSIARMRGEILELSNKFFKDMTNKPYVFDHLEYINDNSYLMTIIKKDGTRVPHGSTGEMQVVTMSFLLALSKCSGKTTPIVMDTPMTNLDDVHSEGVKRSLMSINNQVIFLAQPAETTNHFVDGVKGIIAKIYNCKHDESDNGTIVEVKI